MVDTGAGVFPVYYTPRLTGPNPNYSFLADSQNNKAWAVFGDAAYEISHEWEIELAARYDEDNVQNTTDTPTQFLPDPANSYTGEVRQHTFDELQPKGTLRYKPSDEVTIYGGWSRGFRSGGFNQTGVGAVARANGVQGINDLFNAEVADTWEVGIKSQLLERRVNAGLSLYDTKSHNGYFFLFLAANSTQNIGNLDAEYKGAELEVSAKATEHLDIYANAGYSHGVITDMADRTVIGNEPPLLTKDTLNAGFQYHEPVREDINAVLRLDYRYTVSGGVDPRDFGGATRFCGSAGCRSG